MLNKLTSILSRITGFVLYCAGYSIFAVIGVAVWKRKVYGRANVPKKGAVILAANHISFADPPMIGSSAPRFIHYMAKEELFRGRIIGWLLKKVNAIPVKRGEADVKPLRALLSVLQKGGAVLVFPEGTRQRPGSLGRARPGVGFLARQIKATVIPVFIKGSEEYANYKPISVYFGEKIDFGNIEAMADEEISETVMKHIAELQNQHLK